MREESQKKSIAELIKAGKFVIVGGLNTVIDFGIYTLFLKVFGLDAVICQIIGYCCGLVNSYFFNTRWVFKEESDHGAGQAVKFIVVNAVALGVSTGIISLLANNLHWDAMLAKVVATVCSFAVNYIGNRLFTFRQKKAESSEN